MEVNMQNFKLNITEIPTYLDGFKGKLFEIKQKVVISQFEYIEDIEKEIWFQELSITDRLRFEAEQRKEKNLTMKNSYTTNKRNNIFTRFENRR